MSTQPNGSAMPFKMDHRQVAQVLASAAEESCNPSQIGYYETLVDLVKKVRSSRTWQVGEVFVHCSTPDSFVVMKQVAPASCEMLTISQNGFHDVLTAFRFEEAELLATLQSYMTGAQAQSV